MNNQEKLEAFEPYLPYGVFVKTDYDSVFNMGIVNNISFSRTIDVIIENDYKPILYPLSYWTKPCLEGGKIPKDELNKLYPAECIGLNIAEWSHRSVTQLIKWHFWIGDQSEFGKSIIDINTIKTE